MYWFCPSTVALSANSFDMILGVDLSQLDLTVFPRQCSVLRVTVTKIKILLFSKTVPAVKSFGKLYLQYGCPAASRMPSLRDVIAAVV